MAIGQTIWSLDDRRELDASALLNENELEDLIAANIRLLNDSWMVIGRQVRTTYGGIIDLLCVDVGGDLIVVEFKRDMTPREVTAQALDYASWVSELDADELARIYLNYSGGKSLDDAFEKHFGRKPDADIPERNVSMVIVATGMDGSTERILRYLQGFGIRINVLFFSVFADQGRRYTSRAFLFDEEAPPPRKEDKRAWNGECYVNFADDANRSWTDARQYGFVSAGGGSWYVNTLRSLEPGERIWVNIPGRGYAGVGTVLESAVPASDAIIDVDGTPTAFFSLPLHANYRQNINEEKQEYVVKVEWEKTVPLENAVKETGMFGNQNTVARPRADSWDFTVQRLSERWGVPGTSSMA